MDERNELKKEMMAFALRLLRNGGTGEELAILPQVIELLFGSCF